MSMYCIQEIQKLREIKMSVELYVRYNSIFSFCDPDVLLRSRLCLLVVFDYGTLFKGYFFDMCNAIRLCYEFVTK